MSMISQAIAEGVDQGFEEYLASKCGGYNQTKTCPMSKSDGCACLRTQWRSLPWWKKMFVSEPKKPSGDAVLKCITDLALDSYLLRHDADGNKITAQPIAKTP
jgi:hypothetical protein